MRSKYGVWLVAIIAGLLMVLSSVPFDQWYLSYVAYVPLFLVFRNKSPFQQGLGYALCCSVIAANWWHSTIIFSVLFFLLIVSILCFSFFIWGYLSAKIQSYKNNQFIKLFMPAIIWVGIERILSSEIVGIPCNIGISQSGQPELIQSASLFGIYATSFLIVLSNTLITSIIIQIKEKKSLTKIDIISLFSAIILLASNFVFGLFVLSSQDVIKTSVKVAIIQPVITTNMYLNGWRSPETRTYIKNTLKNLSVEALKNKPDLLVWPEGGNGYFNMRLDVLRDELYEMAINNNVNLLISSNDLDEDGRKYNSVFSISNTGELLGRYDKVNLIPGAEDSYTAGSGFHTIKSMAGDIGPVICYESNFPSPFRKVTDLGAELLFVSTSDAAFKKTALTINHTRTAVFRAVENNRWVVHASNTGPSTIVSPYGVVTANTNMFEKGYAIGDVEYIKEKSFFTLYGYIVPIIFSFGVMLAILYVLYMCKGSFVFTHKRIKEFHDENLLDDTDMELAIKSGLIIIFKALPVSFLYIAFILSVISSSVVIVYKRTSPDISIQYIFDDFFEPLDTLAVDSVTEKFLQAKSNTCGPAVLAYIFSYFGKELVEEDIIKQIDVTDNGTSLLQLRDAALLNGFNAFGYKENYTALMSEPLPVIAYINNDHYVVINKLTESSVYMFDPAIGHIKINRNVFEQVWNGYLLLVRMKPIKEKFTKISLN
ncbi:MAG: cysteine peptidase family C39 domain-containing protein [Pseudomonadota bacterium]